MRNCVPILLAVLLACFGSSAQMRGGDTSPRPPSFRNHVQPILAKAGCSSGACHGAAAGQGGFRMSLRGYDDEGDWLTLTRGAFGRRVNLTDPARSLLLLKPTAAVPHKGDKKFEVGSPEWQTIVNWIAHGAPGPQANDPRITRIEITPRHVRLEVDGSQQLSVRAFFSDNTEQDVTRYAKFTATNQSVINVDDNGKVQVVGHGESAVTAWFLQKITAANVSVPFANEIDEAIYAAAPRRNWIDELVLSKLRELRLAPSPRCSDGEFIRRVYLDALGILPTAGESRAFIADAAPEKRDLLIERVLKRPEFVDYWSYKWSDLLLVTKRKLKPAAMWSYYRWIRDRVASNTPWDVFARELVTAQGSTLENGAANFFVIHQDPRELSETVAMTFLGISTNCAKCHNHPMEKWTNDDYFGFANLVARVKFKNGASDGDQIVFADDKGDLVQPLTGRPQPPRPLGGKAIPLDSSEDRRAVLAQWLTSPENPYFARAIVNRVWANYLGVGLVEAVDDVRETNPASNEQLFTAAAKWLVDHRYDLRAFMREILQSETYQRSSVALPENKDDTRFYSRYYPRRLMAEVLHDAIAQASGVPTEFKTQGVSDAGDKPTVFPLGWRALQLPDSNTSNYLTRAFGRPNRDATCECERTDDPNVTQALHLANGDTINKKLADEKGTIALALGAKRDVDAIAEDAWMGALSRTPSPRELEKFRALFAEAKDDGEKRRVVEDTYWALLTSREFLFNH